MDLSGLHRCFVEQAPQRPPSTDPCVLPVFLLFYVAFASFFSFSCSQWAQVLTNVLQSIFARRKIDFLDRRALRKNRWTHYRKFTVARISNKEPNEQYKTNRTRKRNRCASLAPLSFRLRAWRIGYGRPFLWIGGAAKNNHLYPFYTVVFCCY